MCVCVYIFHYIHFIKFVAEQLFQINVYFCNLLKLNNTVQLTSLN